MWSAREESRLAAIMYVRGFAVLALGAIGLRWPSVGLVPVVGIAGSVVTLLGVMELAVAWTSAASRSVRSVLHYVAAVSMAFGVVSLTVYFASSGVAVATLAAWLVMHASVALMAASMVSRPTDRRVLLGWSVVNLLAALVVAVLSVGTFFALLYAGAAYTAMYGVLQIAIGLRLRSAAILSVSSSAPSTSPSA